MLISSGPQDLYSDSEFGGLKHYHVTQTSCLQVLVKCLVIVVIHDAYVVTPRHLWSGIVLAHGLGRGRVKCIQRLHGLRVLAEHLLPDSLQPMRIVPGVVAVPDAEDTVELLQGHVLGLGDEEVGEYKPEDVPRGIPIEATRHRELVHHLGPSEADEEVKGPGNGRGGRHAHGADVQGKGFRAIRKGHRAEARRVYNHEGVEASRHHGQAQRLVRDEEARSSREQQEGHDGERDEEQAAPPATVDGEDCGNCPEEIADAAAKRDEQCVFVRVSGVDEDLGAIIGDDVDC